MTADDHLDGRDVDAEFAAIIAGWDSVPDLPDSLTDHPTSADGDTLTHEPDGPADAAAGRGGAPVPPAGESSEPDAPGLDLDDGSGPAGTPHDGPAADSGDVADPPVPAPSAPGHDVPPPGIVEASLDEGHFEPAPVQLPPQEDLHFWGIVIGLTVGPVLLLWMAFFGENHSSWWTIAALAMSLGGFVLLVLRQPRHRDEDDPDNGARL